jgi:hypothetical protein
MDPEIKQRLIKLAGNRINDQGVLKSSTPNDSVLRNKIVLMPHYADRFNPESNDHAQKAKSNPSERYAKAARRGEKRKHSETKRLRRYITRRSG